MNQLYELTLNRREFILSKVTELCYQDSYISNSCTNREIIQSIIHFFANLVFDSINKGINELALSPLFVSRLDLKLLIIVLKHFRSKFVELLFSEVKSNEELYKNLEDLSCYFDSIELSVYSYWEGQTSESMKKLNEVIENDKIKTEFLSNLSHELRTPLNVILGSLQLVDMYSSQTEDPNINKTNKYYKIMRQNCYRLLRLVNNLIDINKLDAGYMQLNMDNHDIVSIVTKISVSVADYIQNKNIEFEYSTSVESQIICCDPDKIERIILNLLSNAVKFTDVGGSIQVRLWKDEETIYISVKDNGIGIPKEKQDLLFKRFVQIDKSLSRNYQGSGIGLSLVKSLVEMHEGRIKLISDSGMGCEFIIEMPIKQTTIADAGNHQSKYNSNNKIEIINIEFADIYS